MIVTGVDIGGTFTDLMLYDTGSGDVVVHKVRSTPSEPERAMIEGLQELCRQAGRAPSEVDAVFHGTTVATNAVLTHQGAVAGMITNRGFRDVVHIGRHQRPQHYSIMQDIPWQARPFVQRRHRKVVGGRLAPPRGEELEPLAEDEVRQAAGELRAAGVQSVAICFLFSYLNPETERRAAAIVREEMPDAFVTASAEVFPQFREFERFTTASMNAFVGPTTGRYLERLGAALTEIGVPGDLHVMMSNGGVASAAQAALRPVTLMLSGPAAGVLGGQWAAQMDGRARLITFDMGGTSADIGIVTERGVIEAQARDTSVAGYPLLVPMIDIHTIGAGGGSVAYRDAGGAFRVGPRSAGATPGPAAYGAVSSRRSPTRTSCWVASTPTGSWGARCRSTGPRHVRRSKPSPPNSAFRSWRRPKGSSRSPTPTWRVPFAHGRSRKGTTHASSPWSRSGAPARCTRPRSPMHLGPRRCSCRRTLGSPPPPGC